MLDLLRHTANRVPAFIDGARAMTENLVSDWIGLLDGLPGDDLEAWDPEYIRRTLPILGPLFSGYFRGEVRGLENLPAEGPALLVGNHSGGTLIADTFVFTMRFYEHFGPERRFHQLAHDVAARLPGLGIRPYGTVRASHRNAEAAFERDALVLVYPGGDYETFRPSTHSDQIEFGGRSGFVKLALSAGVPIIPIVAIGGQETALFVSRGERLASLIGLDRLARIKVLPISIGPPFGLSLLDLPPRIPLPAKITIEVLAPVDLEQRFGANPDPEVVYRDLTDDMQAVLSRLADERTAPILG